MFDVTVLYQLLQVCVHALTTLAWTAVADSLPSFSVGTACGECPGSMFTVIGAAWANVAYVTHSDILYYFNAGSIAKWAPLLYAFAAIGALISVALGAPPKQYVWFILGPACYFIAIGTTQDVHGVKWKVAGREQDMTEVYKLAEVGLRNTDGANEPVGRESELTINPEWGVVQTFQVSTVLLYVDELLSATAEQLIDMTGLYRQMGNQSGGNKSNLAEPEGGGRGGSTGGGGGGDGGAQLGEGPWFLLSNLKWGMLENIVGATVRDPDVRDAFVTFLSSECGERFKQAIHSGGYIAASNRGAFSERLPMTVMNGQGTGAQGAGSAGGSFDGTNMNDPQFYDQAKKTIAAQFIPTPRSLVRVFLDRTGPGAFAKFSQNLGHPGRSESNFRGGPLGKGRDVEINCMEYLYTVVQAFRWESGHAYVQLLKSAPGGLNEAEVLQTFTYGWNVRRTADQQIANVAEVKQFIRQLIFVYLVRNELLYAPQITEVDQRNSPSQQAKSYSQAFVRTSGSKSKFAELFQWAVLMPHLQGIIVYLVIVAYPFAVVLLVIPGHHKALFTWVLFFTWIKMWDVGFAVVQVLERSVWAMIGNNDSIGRAANYLIQTAERTGSVAYSCDDNGPSVRTRVLGELCALPEVCHVVAGRRGGGQTRCSVGEGQTDLQSLMALDKALALGASIDLDLMNGYYIYIMAALYFAVPTISAQLILGAKSGMASSIGSTFNQQAGEAGKSAQTGFQQQTVQNVMANQAALGQAAAMKAQRSQGLAEQVLSASNEGLDMGRDQNLLSQRQSGLRANAEMFGHVARGRESSNAVVLSAADAAYSSGKAIGGLIGKGASMLGGTAGKNGAAAGTGSGTGAGEPSTFGLIGSAGGKLAKLSAIDAPLAEDRLKENAASAFSTGYGADMQWDASRLGAQQAGQQMEAQRMGKYLGAQVDAAVYEAKAEFGANVVAAAGIAGMNAGNLNPGQKPTDYEGLSYGGYQGSSAQQKARYGGAEFKTQTASMFNFGKSQYGTNQLMQHWDQNHTTPTKVGTDFYNNSGEFWSEPTRVLSGGTIGEQVGQLQEKNDRLNTPSGEPRR